MVNGGAFRALDLVDSESVSAAIASLGEDPQTRKDEILSALKDLTVHSPWLGDMLQSVLDQIVVNGKGHDALTIAEYIAVFFRAFGPHRLPSLQPPVMHLVLGELSWNGHVADAVSNALIIEELSLWEHEQPALLALLESAAASAHVDGKLPPVVHNIYTMLVMLYRMFRYQAACDRQQRASFN